MRWLAAHVYFHRRSANGISFAELEARLAAVAGERPRPAPSGAAWLPSPQLFNRYPVLKIHHTSARQTTRNTAVMPRLTATLTSATSKKLQRKPLIR